MNRKGQSQDYLWQIALTLQHHGIISQVTEEMIRQACDGLRKLAAEEGYGPVEMISSSLTVFIPQPFNRRVSYDTEYVDCGKEYAELVQEYANATMAEWTPDHLTAERIHIREGQCLETIDFDFRGQHFHWQFEADGSDWVQHAFVELMNEFAANHLEGAFFLIYESICTQGVLFYYLPHKAVFDLNTIIEQASERFLDLDAFVEAL
jgi:hypothetical protein